MIKTLFPFSSFFVFLGSLGFAGSFGSYRFCHCYRFNGLLPSRSPKLKPVKTRYLVLGLTLLFMPYGYADQKTILVFGDSISAGYGMQADESWASLLAGKLMAKAYDYKVVNASVSGETTGGGVVRLESALKAHKPALLVLELGGNDGLRGYPIGRIRENLATMIKRSQAANIEVLLIGMVLPPNYGRRYTLAFENIYAGLAEEFDVELLPFLLDGIATSESLMQRDGIHPKAEAQHLLLKEIWPYIEGFIQRKL